jgi:osmotically-inducible protein OsmY
MRRRIAYSLISDEKIRNAIKDAFSYDPRLSPFNLNVSVNIGTVTLTGYVHNLKAKHVAEQDAKNTVGVWHIKNHLKVRPDIRPNTDPIPDVDREIGKKSGLQKS